jgi:hypothetical protein
MGVALKDVLILGVKGEGLKETCHFIRVSLSIRESGFVVLWKISDEPDWDRASFGCLSEEWCLARFRDAASCQLSSSGCDVVNMQVYFWG